MNYSDFAVVAIWHGVNEAESDNCVHSIYILCLEEKKRPPS